MFLLAFLIAGLLALIFVTSLLHIMIDIVVIIGSLISLIALILASLISLIFKAIGRSKSLRHLPNPPLDWSATRLRTLDVDIVDRGITIDLERSRDFTVSVDLDRGARR